MRHLKVYVYTLLMAVALLVVATGCNHYISTFDQYAYAQTTALKIDVLNLIDKSTEPYTVHEAEIAEVTSNMMKAAEYEKHRPKNNITIQMWSKLMDSTAQNGIVGRYLASWKKNGTKGEAVITEVKQQVSEGFDLIADLESHKLQSAATPVVNFLHK